MAAENTATFAIDLNAQGAQAGAEAAAGSLEKLRDQVDEDTAALGNMQKALKALQGGTSVNIQAFQNLKKQIEAKKATIAQTQERFLQLGGTFKKTKKPVDDNADALKGLFEKMQKGGGPLGGLAGRLQGLRGLLAGGGALVVGGVAFAGVLLAVAAAALVATGALLKYGIAAADAYRSERLQLEGLTKLPNWYGVAAGKAGEMQEALDRVSGSVASGRGELAGMQTELYKTGFRGAALENALLGVATAQSAAGEAGGAFAKQLFLAYGQTAAGAKKAGDQIKARFGAIAAAQMLSLNVQSKKLHESFQALFTGLKIEGFLGALKSVTDLFSQNTASGRALKQILEVALQPLIDGMASAGPIAKRFFQGMIIAAQELMIAYYDVRLALKGAFGDVSLFKNVDLLAVALIAGRAAVYTFAIGLGLVVATLAILGAVIAAPIVAFVKFQQAAQDAGSFLSSLDWTSLGKSLVDGFVNGILAGVGKVVGAVKGLADAAKSALRIGLDSHSPSRIGIAIGRTLPQGGAIGIEQDTPLVARAAKDMADTASEHALPRSSSLSGGGAGGAAAGSAGAAGAAASTVTVHAPITIHAGPKADASDIANQVREVLVAQLTGVAISMGAM